MSGNELKFSNVVDKTRRAMGVRRKLTDSTSSNSFGSSVADDSENSVKSRGLNIDFDALENSVAHYFGRRCTSCSKMTDGGFHSIYVLGLEEDVTDDPEIPIEFIARIAFPTFRHDKLESEAATKRFIKARSIIPVPKIYFWDSDPDNPVGAEYIIMEKAPGESGEAVWPTFSKEKKASVMVQLAEHLSEVLRLRVDSIGSLYLKKDPLKSAWKKSIKFFDKSVDDNLNVEEFEIGRSVCTLYCTDPEDEFPRTSVADPNRGPFKSAGEWLSSIPEHELSFTKQHTEEALEESIFLSTPPNVSGNSSEISMDEPDVKGKRRQSLEYAQRSLSSLIDVAKSYCGPAPGGPLGHLTSQFSLLHHDFRLSNLQIDPETAQITGILDWEATHSAPLWACARLPNWLQDTMSIAEQQSDGESLTCAELQGSIGEIEKDGVPLRVSSPSTRRALSTVDTQEVRELRELFLEKVSPEWREAYEVGRHWRAFQDVCCLNWMSWTELRMRERIDLYREQAAKNPGVPLDEEELESRIRGTGSSIEIQ